VISVSETITLSGRLRQHGQERIDYLASIRNELVAPFVAHADCGQSNDFGPDFFLFVNDVYWCSDDMIRLMQHDADIACGIDVGKFDRIGRRSLLSGKPQHSFRRHVHTAASNQPQYDWRNLIHIHKPSFGINNVVFYDIW
jgi:hypothetical protein